MRWYKFFKWYVISPQHIVTAALGKQCDHSCLPDSYLLKNRFKTVLESLLNNSPFGKGPLFLCFLYGSLHFAKVTYITNNPPCSLVPQNENPFFFFFLTAPIIQCGFSKFSQQFPLPTHHTLPRHAHTVLQTVLYTLNHGFINDFVLMNGSCF